MYPPVTETNTEHYTLIIYTLNHKKRDILFLTITLANLKRFFIICISSATVEAIASNLASRLAH